MTAWLREADLARLATSMTRFAAITDAQSTPSGASDAMHEVFELHGAGGTELADGAKDSLVAWVASLAAQGGVAR
jgi:hypothetical protein